MPSRLNKVRREDMRRLLQATDGKVFTCRLAHHPHGLAIRFAAPDGERETRELIVRENRRYAKRQLIWFRKEPNLRWIHAAGQREETLEEVARALAAMERRPDGPADP
jgi:hypothetical protein